MEEEDTRTRRVKRRRKQVTSEEPVSNKGLAILESEKDRVIQSLRRLRENRKMRKGRVKEKETREGRARRQRRKKRG